MVIAQFDKDNPKDVYKQIVIVALIATFVRVIAAVQFLVISKDSIIYLSHIKTLSEGSIGPILAHPYHPLYTILCWLVYSVTGSLFFSGQFVSMLFGTLTIIPLYWIAYRFFGKKAAVYASVLLAFHPFYTELSAEILTDATSIFFFATGVAFIVEALHSRPQPVKRIVTLCALAGLASGLAYLTRPEGIGIMMAGAFMLFLFPVGSFKKEWLKRVLLSAVIIAMFAVVALPYMRSIGWKLTNKKDAGALAGITETKHQHIENIVDFRKGKKTEKQIAIDEGKTLQNEAGRLSFPVLQTRVEKFTFLPAIGEALRVFSEATQYPLLALIVVGVCFACVKKLLRYDKLALLGVVCALYFLVYIRLILNTGYVSGRHVLLVTLILMPFAGVAIARLVEYGKNIPGDRKGVIYAFCRNAGIGLFILALGIMSFKTFRPSGLDKKYIKEAAAIMNANSDSSILGGDSRIAFYASAEHQRMPRGNIDDIIEYSYMNNIEYIITESSEISRLGMDMDEFDQDSRLQRMYEHRDEQDDFILRVYKILTEPEKE